MTIPMPVEISDVTLAFPANALEFMPKWEDIPDEFKSGSTPHREFVRTWFYEGLSETWTGLLPIDRVDPLTAFRQLSAIAGSYASKHDHKVASMAYLCASWFQWITYAKSGRDSDGTDLITIDSCEAGPEFLAEWTERQSKPLQENK